MSEEDGTVYETTLDANKDNVLSIREIFASSVAGIDATVESLTDPDNLRELVGRDVLVLRGELDTLFRDNFEFFDSNLGLSFYSSNSREEVQNFADSMGEENLAEIKQGLSERIPSQSELINDMSAFELAQMLKIGFAVYEQNLGDEFNAGAFQIFDDENNVSFNVIALPSDEEITWQDFMGREFFDEDIDVPYDNNLISIAILGHEIEHLTQGEIIELFNDADIQSSLTNNIKELDADVGAMEMMRSLFPTEADADAFIEYFDAARIVQGFGRSTEDYMHGMNGDAVRDGELLSPGEIIDVQTSVYEEVSSIMREYGHEDREVRMDERLSATHGENLFILKQMSMSDDYTPQQQAFIGEAIEAFELIGITPVDIREPLPEAEAARAAEARSELNTAFDNARQDSVPTPEDAPAPVASPIAPETAPVPEAPSV